VQAGEFERGDEDDGGDDEAPKQTWKEDACECGIMIAIVLVISFSVQALVDAYPPPTMPHHMMMMAMNMSGNMTNGSSEL
jgi:hypothetical protein